MGILLLSWILAFGGGASHVVGDVPFVKQEAQYCGPASLASVLSHYGDGVEQETIGRAVFSPKLQGALITDLENYSRQRGFQTRSGRGSLAEIRAFLSEDRPVIVLVDLGFWVISRPHYLVVYGCDEQGFLAHDGFEAAQRYAYDEFEKIWERAGSTYLLVYR